MSCDAVPRSGEALTYRPGLFETLRVLRALPSYEDIEAISERVRDLKAAHPGWTNTQAADVCVRRRTRRMSLAGAAAALPGAFPGIGTVAQIGLSGATFTTEVWLLLRNMAYLHYEVAAAYDQDLHHNDLQDDLVIAWGLTTGAVIPARDAARRVGARVAVIQFKAPTPGRWLSILNRKLGATVLTKFGTKRGGVALRRLIPLGVGVIINAAVNYVTVRSFGRSSIRLYNELLPGDGDLIIPGAAE